jgi:hypothetical protein
MLAGLLPLLATIAQTFSASPFYHRSVHLLSLSFDIFIASHLFFIPLNILTGQRLSVPGTLTIMLNALLFNVLAHLLDEQRRKSLKEVNDVGRGFRGQQEMAIYFFLFQQQIEWTKERTGDCAALMQGKLIAHFEECG